MNSPEPFLAVKDLSFSYDRKKPALRDLSFSIGLVAEDRCMCPGDVNFISIIGPNGSGKTTLMKLLAGILEPGAGTIEILGHPIHSRMDPSKILAYVPQTLAIGFSLSVLDFVLLGTFPAGNLFRRISAANLKKAREALGLLRMETYEGRDMLRLSGGEKQKIILTKALAQDTPVILLDEPITHLDLSGQIEILDLLKKMSLAGKKIIAIMHDINLAARYSDYTIIMKDGQLFAAGGTSETITEKTIRDCFSVKVEKMGDFFIPVKSESYQAK
jgi:iron complex transport system ATP-binding protein